MLRDRLIAFCFIPGHEGFRAMRDSDAAQTHAGPFQGPPHTKASRDGSAHFSILCSYPLWMRPNTGRIAVECPRMALSWTRLARPNTSALLVNTYVESRQRPTTPREPTPAAEPFAGDGEERWVWCSILAARISWPQEASRDVAPACIR
jgi:hypothetical protein